MLDETQERVCVTPRQREIRVVEKATLVTFHRKGDSDAGGYGIQPQVIAQPVGVDDNLGVVNPAHWPQGVERLVLWAFQIASVRTAFDAGDAAASDGAGEAALGLARVAGDGLGVHLICPGHLAQLVVAGWQVSGEVLDGDQADGAPVAQADDVGMVAHLFGCAAGQCAELRREIEGSVSAHDDGLEILASHHRAATAAGRCPSSVADDGGKANGVLPCRPDAGHAGTAGRQGIVGGPGAQSPEVVGGPDDDTSRCHFQIDGLFGAAGDDECVVPGAAQGCPKEAASVGVAVDGREGGVEGDVVAGPGRPRGAGQRPDGKDERVFGCEWVGRVGQMAEEQRAPQSPPAQEAGC